MLGEDAAADALLPTPSAASPPPSPGRWAVLTTVSLLAINQSATWALPGTVASAFAGVYGLSPDTVQLLANYGSIFFFLGAWPSMFLLDRFGCALPVRLAALLMLASNALRSLATGPDPASVALVHASAILCALAGPVAMAIPSRLACDWFPALERTTATAVAATASQVGGVVIYAAVPLLCPGGDGTGLKRLNSLLLALSLLNGLGALAYLPPAPPLGAPSPSSRAAAAARSAQASSPLALLRALGRLYAQPAYLVITATYAACGGVFSAAGVFLPANLAPLGASLSYAAWVGVAVNVGSLALGVGVAAGGDALKARLGTGWAKRLLVGVTLAGGACFAVFAGAVAWGGGGDGSGGGGGGGGGWALPTAAASYTLGGSLFAAQVALSYDLAAEHAWGVAPDTEGTCLMGVSLPMNTVTLAALLAPAASLFAWLNWAQAGSSLAAAGALWLLLPAGAPKCDFDLAEEARLGPTEGAAAAAAAAGF